MGGQAFAPIAEQTEDIDRHTIRFGPASYDLFVSSGPSAFAHVAQRLEPLAADRFLIVVDDALDGATVARLRTQLATVAPCTLLRLPASERSKTVATLAALADRALATGVTRRSCVVAVGGGLVGNVAGLLAALLFRGIRLVHVPTTLLAMSDSVLSLKQAVNSSVGKNHLGTFHAPVLVWNELGFLRSLPADEIRAALCELIKNVLAICPQHYDEVARLLHPAATYDDAQYRRVIELCVEAKSAVMADDHTEKGPGLVLEYGHTVGHAIELASDGAITHGLAIGLGMLVAARVARRLGLLDVADERAHEDLLRRNGAPLTIPPTLTGERIMSIVWRDNKRGYLPARTGTHDMVLLEALGRPARSEGTLLTRVPTGVLMAAIEEKGAR